MPYRLPPSSASSLLATACLAIVLSGCHTATPTPVAAAAVRVPASMPAGCTQPAWPPGEKRRGAQGRVTLHFTVEADGQVSKAAVIRSSGYPALDEAARDTLAKCVFQPETLDGKPVASKVIMPYQWINE
ncbi:energy transducer TonB [Janthinobacterium sp. PAMC25594]|uniref:energy transducer TonB n=1 Tax=Janthinobacterium sp. PAMC25594 TaxID=2861284 RepID=UPI001C632486|nr:energy transducer TonB [Janthinobacterium sp. PAMC25594]QYG04669.1 energy transducer TonB [Janthinobacterium sp. PAMC25594]